MRRRVVSPDPASPLQNAPPIPITIPGVGTLAPGTIFSVKGDHGRYKFTTASADGTWVEAFGGLKGHSQFRAFRIEAVKRIERKP